jgi:hypothetical protein
MTDLDYKQASGGMKIVGDDENYAADVVLQSGVKRLATTATVSVEQIFGFDDFADTWFQILTTGAQGNTWRIKIAAGSIDTTSPDSDPPAIDTTYTVLAGDVGNELTLRDSIIAHLNGIANFSNHWKASSVKDNAIVHISSKYIGEFGERLGATDFEIIVSGSATFSYLNSDNQQIKRRGKQNSGTRDSRDKRLVTVGVSGEISAVPGSVGDLFIESAMNGVSSNLRVSGSIGTPIIFTINTDAVKDTFIESIRFYGNGSGIQFGKFLSQSGSGLTNGILVEIKSDGVTTQLPVIKTTDDFKHKFSFPYSAFELHVQSGRDDFMATFNFSVPFPLRKSGTILGGDDYIKVYIRDNLTAGLAVLEFLAKGFQKEV